MPERITTPRGVGGDIALLAQKVEIMGDSIEDLKAMVKELSTSMQALEKREIVCQGTVLNRADANHGRIEDHEKRLVQMRIWQDEAQKILNQIQFGYKVVAFIGSAVGLSIIALIWALITGQAVIGFK